MLSLAGGASEAAGGPAGDAPKEKAAPVITLGEEEILDVSLSTFYVFDMKTPKHVVPIYNLPNVESTEVAERTQPAAAAEATRTPMEAAEAA